MIFRNFNVSASQLAGQLLAVFSTWRGTLISLGLISGLINILMLTGAFFMLQVYDRVLPSHSIPTLVALTLFACVLFIFLGVLDVIRSRTLLRIGTLFDESMSRKVYLSTIALPLKAPATGGMQSFRDLDQVRSFLSGSGPTAIFDLPWMPVYLFICYMFHPLIGMTALLGAIILVSITALTEMLVRSPAKRAVASAGARHMLAEASHRNAEVLRAMGMAGRAADRWSEINNSYVRGNQAASDLTGMFGSISKILRMALQSGILAVGAWLVIHQEATGGVIIAGAILSARALAPVELAIANWQGFVNARQSWHRLNELVTLFSNAAPLMRLPNPHMSLRTEAIDVIPPGSRKVAVGDVTLSLERGDGLGIIGPSASGKSSLARAIVGVWSPARGRVRLDGAALDQWTPEALGQHIGYLPQDSELFAGTVGQNIARFDSAATPESVIAAADAAGVHELILNLPNGYETEIGEGGAALSAGQRQRIALARALYGDPFLVVLDEPNSNLDAAGDRALAGAIRSVRARGGIAIIVAHRPSALEAVDLVLMLGNGRVQAFGRKDEVLQKVLHLPSVASPPLQPVAGAAMLSNPATVS